MAFIDYGKYFVYFLSAFVFIPGGRDIVAPGKPVMPGDEKLFDIMKPKEPAVNLLWNTCCMAFLEARVPD